MPVWAVSWAWLPCRSDDGARTCRLPLTHSPPAFYSCFSWTCLHLLFEPTGLSSRKQLKKKKKSWFCAPHPPLKTLNWSLSIDGEGRSRWRTVKARSARSCRSGSAQFSLKNSDYSFRVVPGAGEKNSRRAFLWWRARFPSVRMIGAFLRSLDHLDLIAPPMSPPPPAPVPSELPWQREEAGHTARLIFGQCKQGDADLCKITQRFRLLRWETRKWIFTDRMTQILGSWEDLRYKSVRRVVGSHDFISNSYFFR